MTTTRTDEQTIDTGKFLEVIRDLAGRYDWCSDAEDYVNRVGLDFTYPLNHCCAIHTPDMRFQPYEGMPTTLNVVRVRSVISKAIADGVIRLSDLGEIIALFPEELTNLRPETDRGPNRYRVTFTFTSDSSSGRSIPGEAARALLNGRANDVTIEVA